VFVLISVFFGGLVNADCGPWIPLDVNTLPQAAPGDKINVFYLVAPLMECEYGNDFTVIDAYHGGLGIINTNTGFAITLNYDAIPNFNNALLPYVNTSDNTLQWSNQGAVFIYNGINETFWYSNMELVANINGDQYNKYMTWIKNFNTSYPWYDLWTSLTDWPGDFFQPYSHDCFSFVWQSYAQLTSLGAVIVPSQTPIGLLTFYTDSAPFKVDMTNPTNQLQVFKFYKDMSEKIEQLGVLGLIVVMVDLIFEPHYYFHVGTDYYEVKLVYPYVGTIYDNLPVNSGNTLRKK
jgi:hypothetical protein